MTTPRLEIYPEIIRQNAQAVMEQCARLGVNVACVTKVTSAHPSVVEALMDAKAPMLADSRIENLRAIRTIAERKNYHGTLLLLRLPTLSRVREVVEVADMSLVSSIDTIHALADAAQSQGRRHRGILMVELGDLREGAPEEQILHIAKEALSFKGFELAGLGCNLACFGGVIPTPTNTGILLKLHEQIKTELGVSLPIISGGNSSSLPLVQNATLPAGINHLRVGEAIVLGRNVIDRSPWPGTRQDGFVAVGEIIELYRKPSVPIGERGQDAFGNTEEFPERGMRTRAIINLGRQDVNITGLEPLRPGIQVLGGSSDHLILDVEDALGAGTSFKVGDEIKFYPNYGALLALSTSEYVSKKVCHTGSHL